jgi:DNA-binding response OmpR family regulator
MTEWNGPMVVVPAWAVRDRTAIVTWLGSSHGGDLVTSRVGAKTLTLDRRRATVRVQGAEVALSGQVYLLLEALMLSQGRVVTFDELNQSIWGEVYAAPQTSLRVLVHRLRQSLDPLVGPVVGTARGVGYRWLPDPSAPPPDCRAGVAPVEPRSS